MKPLFWSLITYTDAMVSLRDYIIYTCKETETLICIQKKHKIYAI